MKPVDDEIMEVIAESGASTPQALADEIGKNNDYIGTRCRKLTRFGLLVRPARGLYLMTDEGNAYLSGDLDASELEQSNTG